MVILLSFQADENQLTACGGHSLIRKLCIHYSQNMYWLVVTRTVCSDQPRHDLGPLGNCPALHAYGVCLRDEVRNIFFTFLIK